MDKQQDCQ